MRTTFINCLLQQARVDERIFLITPDLGFSILEPFAREFPTRFLNVGIAEQNAIGVAAGLALSGKLVYVYSIIPFVTMRCFEQVRLDIAYMNTNVSLIGVGAGFSYGPAGATHHAIEDIGIMRVLPNMRVCCPGDPVEVRELVTRSFEHPGPLYLRLGKNGEPRIHPLGTHIQIGQGIQVTLGDDLALLTTSNLLSLGHTWVQEWAAEGKQVRLISIPTIKPLDKTMILELIKGQIPIITLEEHNIIGGLGTAVAEVIAESGQQICFRRIGIPDVYSHQVGNQLFLREKYKISKPMI